MGGAFVVGGMHGCSEYSPSRHNKHTPPLRTRQTTDSSSTAGTNVFCRKQRPLRAQPPDVKESDPYAKAHGVCLHPHHPPSNTKQSHHTSATVDEQHPPGPAKHQTLHCVTLYSSHVAWPCQMHASQACAHTINSQHAHTPVQVLVLIQLRL